MREYFELKENQEALLQEATQWMGVPYLHMGCDRGGMDCTKFVGVVLQNLGILEDFPRNVYYPTDWYQHGSEEICLNSIAQTMQKKLKKNLLAQMVPFVKGEIKFGDLVCIAKNAKGLVNHTALYLGENKIVHCLQGKGVFVGQFSYSYATVTRFLFRLFFKD